MATPLYQSGDGIRLSASFTSGGNPADPGAVTWAVTEPDGVVSAPTNVRDSLGQYHADYSGTKQGLHLWRSVGTTPVQQVVEGQFWVDGRWLVTVEQFRDYLGDDGPDASDGRFAQAVAMASAAVRDIAGRAFKSPLVTETRSFRYDYSGWKDIDDLYVATTVALDGRTLTEGADFVLGPDRGYSTYDGGKVFWWMELPYGGGYSPEMGFMWNADTIPYTRRRYGTIDITGQWGWPLVPLAVQQATLLTAAAFMFNPRQATSEEIADYSVTYSAKALEDIPPLAQKLLIPYTRY